MSRSGYSDDCENLALYRGAVESAIRGKRGQRFFADLLAALDAMPVKRLAGDLWEEGDDRCTLAVAGHAKGIDMRNMDPSEDLGYMGVHKKLNIAECLAREVVYKNDEGYSSFCIGPHYSHDDYLYCHTGESSEARWCRMRAWVREQMGAQSYAPGEADPREVSALMHLDSPPGAQAKAGEA